MLINSTQSINQLIDQSINQSILTNTIRFHYYQNQNYLFCLYDLFFYGSWLKNKNMGKLVSFGHNGSRKVTLHSLDTDKVWGHDHSVFVGDISNLCDIRQFCVMQDNSWLGIIVSFSVRNTFKTLTWLEMQSIHDNICMAHDLLMRVINLVSFLFMSLELVMQSISQSTHKNQ